MANFLAHPRPTPYLDSPILPRKLLHRDGPPTKCSCRSLRPRRLDLPKGRGGGSIGVSSGTTRKVSHRRLAICQRTGYKLSHVLLRIFRSLLTKDFISGSKLRCHREILKSITPQLKRHIYKTRANESTTVRTVPSAIGQKASSTTGHEGRVHPDGTSNFCQNTKRDVYRQET